MTDQSVSDPSSPPPGGVPPESDESRSEPNNDSRRLAPPPLSEIGKDRSSAGEGSDGGSLGASRSEALEDPERLRELQESLGRLKDFRHWCKTYSAHSLRAGFITQAIRAGKAERRVKEHSGHALWETFNLCA